MERMDLVQHLDIAALRAKKLESSTTQPRVAPLDHHDLESAVASIAHSLVVIATLLDQIVGRDGLSVGTVRTESGY